MTDSTPTGAAAWVVRRPQHPDARQILLDTIRDQRGQWTTGRVKALYRKTIPTHVWRATIRRHLRQLHAAGHLDLHTDDAGRRYYVYSPKGGTT